MVDLLSTSQSPFAQPQAWDSITIGKLTWKGKIEIKSASRRYKWQVSDGAGFVGALENFISQPPAKFSITFYVWSTGQYVDYLLLLELLRYTPDHYPQSAKIAGANVIGAQAELNDRIQAANASPTPENIANVNTARAALAQAQANPTKSVSATSATALTVVHPQLQNQNINSVVVESIGALEKQSDDLMFSFAVDFIEFVPQRAFQPQSPDTAANNNNPSISPEARDALKGNQAARQRLSVVAASLGLDLGLPK